MRLTSNYSEAQNKDALFAEIESRRSEGRNIPDVSATSKREDLEAALELDDQAGPASQAQTGAPLPQGIPKIEPLPANIPVVSDTPKNEDYKGIYTKRSDGEPYALA